MRVARTEDEQWTLMIGETIDGGELDAVQIPIVNGLLIVGAGVMGMPEGLRIEARIDTLDIPQWVVSLVGEETAKRIVMRLGQSPHMDEEFLDVSLNEERVALLIRFARGLWSRRFWPASADAEAPIPVLDTRLLDLELVEMSLDERLMPLLEGSPLIELLLDIRQEDAFVLAEGIEQMDPAWERQARRVLAGFLEALLESEENDEGMDHVERVERIEAAIPDVDSCSIEFDDENAALWQSYFSSLTSTPVVEFPDFLIMEDDEDEEELALVAGIWECEEEEDDVDPGGCSAAGHVIPIDWRKNLHCLFEPSEGLQWTRERVREVRIEAALYRELHEEADSPRAYVYTDDFPIPIRARIDEAESVFPRLIWRAPVPANARIDVVVCSGGFEPRRRNVADLKEIDTTQKSALQWARERMDSVENMARGRIRPNLFNAPWLAELVALKTMRADLLATEAGAGLYI